MKKHKKIMYKQPVLEFNTPTTNNHIVFFPSFGGINFQMCPKKTCRLPAIQK
jgi:hypothetical protein